MRESPSDTDMSDGKTDVTRLIGAWAAGDEAARERLIPLVYDELRRLAGGFLRREHPGHTLQPTALVHEAFVRFLGQGPVPVECRGQFMALVARTMRRVLVDHARKRNADKRGAGDTLVELNESIDGAAPGQLDVLLVDDALERLAALDPRQARIVELRVFGGLEVREVADLLGLSPATVKRDWTLARAWLHRELSH